MTLSYELKEATYMLRQNCLNLSDAAKLSVVNKSKLAQHCVSIAKCIAATNYAVWGGLSRGNPSEDELIIAKLEGLGVFSDELDLLIVDAIFARKDYAHYNGNDWGEPIHQLEILLGEVKKAISNVLSFANKQLDFNLEAAA